MGPNVTIISYSTHSNNLQDQHNFADDPHLIKLNQEQKKNIAGPTLLQAVLLNEIIATTNLLVLPLLCSCHFSKYAIIFVTTYNFIQQQCTYTERSFEEP